MLEHPADVGVEAWAPSLPEAFEQAVMGLIAVLVDPADIEAPEEREVVIEARDVESLLVKFLSEILFLFDAGHLLVRQVRIEELTPTKLRARVRGEPFRPSKHRVRTDVKAVTYHQISVKRQNEGWNVVVYLDV